MVRSRERGSWKLKSTGLNFIYIFSNISHKSDQQWGFIIKAFLEHDWNGSDAILMVILAVFDKRGIRRPQPWLLRKYNERKTREKALTS